MIEPVTEQPPRKRWFSVTPAIEFGVLALAIAIAFTTYLIIDRAKDPAQLLTPPLVALLLVANLLVCGSLIVLVGRRVARRRAARSTAGGRGELHVRLVAIFSILATVPTVLLAVIASLLFQYGAEFWSSGRARDMLDNAQVLSQESYAELISYVDNENVAMALDIQRMLFVNRWPIKSTKFQDVFAQDAAQRSLSNSILFTLSPEGEVIPASTYQTTDQILTDQIIASDMQKVRAGQSVAGTSAKRTYSLTMIAGTELYLYSTREGGAEENARRLERVKAVQTDYQALLARTRAIQLRFNAALLAISLLIIAITVFIALAVADRLVRPVNELVGAARRVAGGDFAARVPESKTQDEIAALGTAFNRMTQRLEAQTGALVTANAQIESRRALIEAVMSGVSAGVISIDADRNVRLINASATELLRHDTESAMGRRLSDVAPELAALLDGEAREAVIQITVEGEARTLAVKITRDEGGQVLTFDDITQQLLDQRRAAWSDVARRIAHEIKNPLTPIQLAAERLQRRYGKANADEKDGTFSRLTDTIIRQVGDLRRIVDEFSSFARMPKPLFRPESLLDVARQSMFLHEVAHPAIRFEMDAQDPAPSLVCDRRQIGQALTNVVKNAVEAIEAREEGKKKLPKGEIVLTLRQEDRRVILTVADNGIGLPVERDRIAEPYMTTRARGTGLGLAIVKKIIEEHFGTIGFTDRTGGGTVVTVCFDTEQLAGMASDAGPGDDAEPRPAALTRTGSKA